MQVKEGASFPFQIRAAVKPKGQGEVVELDLLLRLLYHGNRLGVLGLGLNVLHGPQTCEMIPVYVLNVKCIIMGHIYIFWRARFEVQVGAAPTYPDLPSFMISHD